MDSTHWNHFSSYLHISPKDFIVNPLCHVMVLYFHKMTETYNFSLLILPLKIYGFILKVFVLDQKVLLHSRIFHNILIFE